jgi:hypothetical protein
MIWVFPKRDALSTWDEYERYPRIEDTALGKFLVIWWKHGGVELARYVEDYQVSHSLDRRIIIDYVNSVSDQGNIKDYLSTHEFEDEFKRPYRYPPDRNTYHFIQDTVREISLSSNGDGKTEGRPYEIDPDGETIIAYMRNFSEREGRWPNKSEIARGINISPYRTRRALGILESAGRVNITGTKTSNARICELVEA